jgi:hypothetical protein
MPCLRRVGLDHKYQLGSGFIAVDDRRRIFWIYRDIGYLCRDIRRAAVAVEDNVIGPWTLNRQAFQAQRSAPLYFPAAAC